MNLTLLRDYTDARCTLGTLDVENQLRLQTLELPWEPLPNVPYGRPDRSCVPEGSYTLDVHDSPRHPHTWALVNPALGVFHTAAELPPSGGRSECLLHPANYVSELEGCIAVGRTRQKLPTGEWWLALSDDAFKALQALLPWAPGNILTVIGARDT